MNDSDSTRPHKAEARFGYVFPAIRGVQAGREFYASMCPLRLLPKIFLFDEDELVPELRAQRRLNKARLPDIARYMLENPSDYTFSALTASIDADVRFEPMGQGREGQSIGVLQVPMDAKFVINDGQHRRAAIELALRENPALGDETIAVVFFLDLGLARAQQMFADLNRHAIRPTTSIGVLYDHRDDRAKVVRMAVTKSSFFRDLVEMERSTLSARSRKLFTLSALYRGTTALIARFRDMPPDALAQRVTEFWEEVARCFPEWEKVRRRQVPAGDVRRDFIHSHGVVLQAIGRAGSDLLAEGDSWKRSIRRLRTLDWSRGNAKLWEGRAMIGGRVSKSAQNVGLTTSAIKTHLGLPLTPEEQRLEDALARGTHG